MIYNHRFIYVLLTILLSTNCNISIYMTNSNAQQFQPTTVIQNGQVTQQYQSQIYQNPMICTNGMLKLIQFNVTNTEQERIQFTYDANFILTQNDIQIAAQPNPSPIPTVQSTTEKKFLFYANCAQGQQNINSQNYYNHIKVTVSNKLLTQKYQFSFLINCDRYNRHKKFEYGYMLVGIINAAITIGVALHSRIWSIKINQKPLRILLTWKLFLILTMILIVIGATFYLLASKQFKIANQVIKYLGLVVGFVFSFICFNQILYLFRPLKKIMFKTSFYDVRICQIASFFIALIIFIISLFVENWILYTFIAGCICVACIKMFYFNSMKQAFYSLAISVSSVTLIAVILHFTLPRSYNDYASQLSSPLFIEVPDLVNNLFKKCSWLPVVDIIVPGVMLSYLRTYDQNRNTGWGGVYTIWGNLSFLVATMFWIGVQALYPFSVPFSLITYSLLLLSICVIAFKRNELTTLWGGYFLQQREISQGLLKQDDTKKQLFNPFDDQTKKAIQIRDSYSSKGDEDQVNQLPNNNDFGINTKVSQSAFRVPKKESNNERISNDPRSSKSSNPFISSIH